MDIVEQLFARARRRPRRIVLPEVEDERIREAAQRLKSEGLAEPLLPSEPYSSLAKYVPLYPGNPKVAERAIRKPLIHAGMMVKAGDADALLAGVAHPTARVIEAGLLTIGLSPGIKLFPHGAAAQDFGVRRLRRERRARRRGARRHRARFGSELSRARGG